MQTVLIKNELIVKIEDMIKHISDTSNKFNFNFLYVPGYQDCTVQLYYKDLSDNIMVIMLTIDIDELYKLLNNIIAEDNFTSLAYNLAKKVISDGVRVI